MIKKIAVVLLMVSLCFSFFSCEKTEKSDKVVLTVWESTNGPDEFIRQAAIAYSAVNPKVEIKVEDAIEFIKDKVDEYDIILIDSTDPMGPGEGLFTEEFYTNVKRSMKKGAILAAQSESPIVNKEEISKMYKLLKKVFPICSTYTSNIPTYPGGYWAWAFCSEEIEPLSYYANDREDDITSSCKIYNKAYHNARFALPNYLKELTK